jgi:hypothetical protein
MNYNRINNKEKFIEKAHRVYNHLYDYSEFVYINSSKKSTIICSVHGKFLKNQNKHLLGQGCPRCKQPNRNITSKEFINKANKIYNNKYNYSKFIVSNLTTKSIIICKIHGEFLQNIKNHLNGHGGCTKCTKIKRIASKTKYNINTFIEKSKKIHGDKYNYEKFIYKDIHASSIIICPLHGEFNLSPAEHIYSCRGKYRGCPKCGIIIRNKKHTLSEEELLKKLNNDKYDYSLVKYTKARDKIKIKCKKHNLIFEQSLDSHINKKANCPRCSGTSFLYTLEEFVDKAKTIHGDKYDYSNFVYINNQTKSMITCKIHGDFLQTPSKHLYSRGCPSCSESYGEKIVRIFLKKNNIDFIKEKRFENCKDKLSLPFDFYIPKLNYCIEYDGKQHYEYIRYMKGREIGEEESIKNFEKIRKHDRIKDEYCRINNIGLLRIPYTEFNNIESILESYLDIK